MLDLEFAEYSDPGMLRDDNEDCLGHVEPETPGQVQSQGWIFVLADGVGGHEDGEQASQLAVETVLEGFRKIPKGVMHVSLLPKLVQEANLAVYDKGHAAAANGAGQRGRTMATTIVVCALRFDSAVVSHVGDSRCYLFREGHLAALTRDHTMAGEQHRMGLISKEEAANGENRHVLTRSLGNELFVAADTVTVNVIPGDVLLLCSDGLHEMVGDEQLEQMLNTKKDLEVSAKAMVAAANEAGGHDNVSVLLVRVRSVERMGLYRGRPYRLL
jgi:serine/threonine protein phosphatase PrpC